MPGELVGGVTHACGQQGIHLPLHITHITRDKTMNNFIPAPDDGASFARTGSSHPLGKFDTQLERINFHNETIDRLRVQASEEGMTLSEYVRVTLVAKAWGLENVQRMYAIHIARIVNKAGA
jgi:hypothetical protein